MSMRIGFCLPAAPMSYAGSSAADTRSALLVGCAAALDAGYDYAECNLGMLMELSEDDLRFLVTEHKNGRLCLEACNCFIPGSYQIVSEEGFAALSVYVEEAMRRMELLGVQIIVFGSGKARELPMQDVRAEYDAIIRFLEMSSEKAAAHGITLVIEPLNKKETNIFNSVSEAASTVRRLNKDSLRLLADCYHMFMENESFVSLYENADLLVHTHAAECPGRGIPGSIDGAYIEAFGSALREIGYNGRVSIECSGYDNFESNIQNACKVMTKAFK